MTERPQAPATGRLTDVRMDAHAFLLLMLLTVLLYLYDRMA